jgi:hypothetical protein
MTITRANVEEVLVRRAKRKMALAEFDTSATGTNPDLDDPIATALRKMGFPASVPIVDADLDDLADTQQDEFLARAELRLLENILGSLDISDLSVGQRRESFGQIVDQVSKAIERLQSRIEQEFGVGALVAGNILLNFSQNSEDTE